MINLLLEMQMPLDEALKSSVVGFILVLIVLAVIALLILGISKGFKAMTDRKSEGEKEISAPKTENPAVQRVNTATAPAPAQVTASAPALPPVPRGYVRLENVSEPTAATIMAIISHQTGIELNRLAFTSIKLLRDELVLENVDDTSAAIIMAIISDKTGIPLNELDFKSIKPIKEN